MYRDKFESKLSNIELMSAKADRGYKNEKIKRKFICIEALAVRPEY